MAKRTTGIDVILDGHTHSVIAHDTVLNAAGKPVVISETGTKFAHIGKLMIRDGRMTHELIPFRTITERNALTKAVTDSINMLMREKTQRVVCHSDVKLRILNEKGDQEVRLAETNLGDVLYRDIFVQFLENNLGGRISNDYLEPQGRIRIKE